MNPWTKNVLRDIFEVSRTVGQNRLSAYFGRNYKAYISQGRCKKIR